MRAKSLDRLDLVNPDNSTGENQHQSRSRVPEHEHPSEPHQSTEGLFDMAEADPFLKSSIANGAAVLAKYKKDESSSPLEREADEVAEEFTNITEPDSNSSSAQGTIEFFKHRMNQDISDTRIHTGASAATATNALNAKAFAIDNNVFIDSDHYAPGTPRGKKLLGHELAHIAQQKSGKSVAKAQRKPKDTAGEPETQSDSSSTEEPFWDIDALIRIVLGNPAELIRRCTEEIESIDAMLAVHPGHLPLIDLKTDFEVLLKTTQSMFVDQGKTQTDENLQQWYLELVHSRKRVFADVKETQVNQTAIHAPQAAPISTEASVSDFGPESIAALERIGGYKHLEAVPKLLFLGTMVNFLTTDRTGLPLIIAKKDYDVSGSAEAIVASHEIPIQLIRREIMLLWAMHANKMNTKERAFWKEAAKKYKIDL